MRIFINRYVTDALQLTKTGEVGQFRSRGHHCEKQQVVATGGAQTHQKGFASVTPDVFCSQEGRA